MKKIVLLVFAIFAVGCSNDNNDDSVNKKMETDFVIFTSQIRVKGSDNRFQIEWSQWKKYGGKYTWNSKSKELTFTNSNGEIDTFKNCVVDGLKVTNITYGTDDWIQNPRVTVFDFSDENTIRRHIDYDSLHDTNGNWTVKRESSDAELRVKK